MFSNLCDYVIMQNLGTKEWFYGDSWDYYTSSSALNFNIKYQQICPKKEENDIDAEDMHRSYHNVADGVMVAYLYRREELLPLTNKIIADITTKITSVAFTKKIDFQSELENLEDEAVAELCNVNDRDGKTAMIQYISVLISAYTFFKKQIVLLRRCLCKILIKVVAYTNFQREDIVG